MRRLGVIFIALLLCFSIGVQVSAFDKKPGKIPEFEKEYVDLSTSVVSILIYGTGIGLVNTWDDKNQKAEVRELIGTFKQSGHGFVVSGGYIVTVAHVVSPERVLIRIGKSDTQVTKLIQVKSITILATTSGFEGGVPCEIYYVDILNDLAILKPNVANTVLTNFNYDMEYTVIDSGAGQVDQIQANDIVVVPSRGRDEKGNPGSWYKLKRGMVVDPKPRVPGFPSEYEKETLLYLRKFDFTTTLPLESGDSGCPILAFKNGKPVIIGIARAKVTILDKQSYGYGVRIDIVKRIIDR
jgi:hypothetical protein